MTEERSQTEPNWLEKAVTAASGIALLIIVAVLIWDGVRPNRPAAVAAVSAGLGEVRGESWYVPVAVRNAGDEAVRDVQITVELLLNGKTEEGSFTVDWLPGRSTRQGVAVLPKEAAGRELKTTVKGFVIP